jgi:predicted protein tyrosine phosphatase
MLEKPKAVPSLAAINKIDTLPSPEEIPNNLPEEISSKTSTTICNDLSSSTRKPTKVRTLESATSALSKMNLDNIVKIEAQNLAQEITPNHLLVDFRSKKQFLRLNIKNSINPFLPALVIKRFRKGMFSSFNLNNFLNNIECQNKFKEWKARSEPKYIIVMDENMETDCLSSDAWAFVSALKEGLTAEICPNQLPPTIGYVVGGFEAVCGYQTELLSLFGGEMSQDITINVYSPLNQNPNKEIEKIVGLNIHAQSDSPKLKTTPTLSLKIKPSSANSTANSPSESFHIPTNPISKITDNISIGSDLYPLAPDGPERLAELGVTHILNMAAEIEPSVYLKNSGKFELKWIPIHDNTEVDLDDVLQDAIQFIGMISFIIDGAIKSNPNSRVFVHCKAGRSRSVSVVIGYLVKCKQFTLKMAYDMIKANRKGVSPNLGFMGALLKLELATLGDNTKVSDLYE